MNHTIYEIEICRGKENSIHNYVEYQYYTEDCNRKGKQRLDTNKYRKHKTHVGCFYTREEILTQIKWEQENYSGKGNSKDLAYSSIEGLLFTGSGAYRIYITDHTVPKINSHAEAIIASYLNEWAGNVYKRSLEGMGVGTHQSMRGSILMGDNSYRAAVSVIEHTLLKKAGKTINVPKKQAASKNKTQTGSNYNLIDYPETIYQPYIFEALPIGYLPFHPAKLPEIAFSR